uniref:Mitochondrial import inner membrane translocase subunit TIM22 n=1 Tax=Pyramimonas obovata TaxID=1411642 RepID=A0A6T7UYM8_9CHLO|mmetsp:Transcript_16352/g.35547  ORF Transcript_16352/g.35547 Transcript_16352/m.35547 type:complete len:168 (+) Transcript_16352:161-664(+)|eukprot:CAMPEP_0118935298 /NCGR_PEP_ID=MMETSP1169-20130426/15367_1 /TAXON_ID=36882 /ORGANISM="Pyramimonas obovata, Strain CCMP722" /LENGTH=167 /DNA_ID=CAMNT_0006878313 /DNA_START=142 /DNA_END=645 /DNA_ORIENTATION=-
MASEGGKKPDIVPTDKKYEQIVMPTPDQIVGNDFFNDSCIARFFIAGIGGAVLGAGMGVLFGSMGDMNLPDPDAPKLPISQHVKNYAKNALHAGKTWGKGMMAFGAVYSASECAFEKARAKHDIYNAGYAGCFTGAALAYKSGPQAMAMGCGSIAAFSMAIDKFMGH